MNFEQKQLPEYQPGVSCHHCYTDTDTDEESKARFKERQKQVALARNRGEQHIGKVVENPGKNLAPDATD